MLHELLAKTLGPKLTFNAPRLGWNRPFFELVNVRTDLAIFWDRPSRKLEILVSRASRVHVRSSTRDLRTRIRIRIALHPYAYCTRAHPGAYGSHQAPRARDLPTQEALSRQQRSDDET